MKNYTILLAEDEKGTQEELRDILGFMCKSVYVASNGLEAKNLYEAHKPDLIITDIKMPKLSGLDLVKHIRRNDSRTSIAIVSAHTDLDYLLLATELNLLKYLVKPITKSKLLGLFKLFKEKRELDEIILSKTSIFYPKLCVIKEDSSVHKLTVKETFFLTTLHEKKSIISYYELEDILELKGEGHDNAIRQFIKKIRLKLPKNYLKNIQSSGYIVDNIYLET